MPGDAFTDAVGIVPGVRALAAGGPMGEAVILVDDVAQKQ